MSALAQAPNVVLPHAIVPLRAIRLALVSIGTPCAECAVPLPSVHVRVGVMPLVVFAEHVVPL
jgi:hypothetical protein